MTRLFALLTLGFVGLCFAGCGGSGDMIPPDVEVQKSAEQLAAEEAYNRETAKIADQ